MLDYEIKTMHNHGSDMGQSEGDQLWDIFSGENAKDHVLNPIYRSHVHNTEIIFKDTIN